MNVDSILSSSEEQRRRFLASLSQAEAQQLAYHWPFWARPEQLAPPGQWRFWTVIAGRGFGKTRVGAEWVRQKKETCGRIAICGQTAADCRDVLVEGESGILSTSPPWDRPIYEPSKRRITWANGAIATTYGGDEPGQLRGPQHDAAWLDELAKWKYPDEAFSNLDLGLRLGDHPQACITTTPRPITIVRELLADSEAVTTRGSTYANLSNLAPSFIRRIIKRYEGTRLGRQELYAELLDDTPGALWNRARLELLRVKNIPAHVKLVRLVLGIDPAISIGEDAGETGMIVAGLGDDEHCYVLDDVTMMGEPAEWGEMAVIAYDHRNVDRIVYERNQGGLMVEHVLKTAAADLCRRGKRPNPHLSLSDRTATQDKHSRAEPISALYAQGLVHHVGFHALLEDQMCTWVPGPKSKSPDRLDALVWAVQTLMLEGHGLGLY